MPPERIVGPHRLEQPGDAGEPRLGVAEQQQRPHRQVHRGGPGPRQRDLDQRYLAEPAVPGHPPHRGRPRRRPGDVAHPALHPRHPGEVEELQRVVLRADAVGERGAQRPRRVRRPRRLRRRTRGDHRAQRSGQLGVQPVVPRGEPRGAGEHVGGAARRERDGEVGRFGRVLLYGAAHRPVEGVRDHPGQRRGQRRRGEGEQREQHGHPAVGPEDAQRAHARRPHGTGGPPRRRPGTAAGVPGRGKACASSAAVRAAGAAAGPTRPGASDPSRGRGRSGCTAAAPASGTAGRARGAPSAACGRASGTQGRTARPAGGVSGPVRARTREAGGAARPAPPRSMPGQGAAFRRAGVTGEGAAPYGRAGRGRSQACARRTAGRRGPGPGGSSGGGPAGACRTAGGVRHRIRAPPLVVSQPPAHDCKREPAPGRRPGPDGDGGDARRKWRSDIDSVTNYDIVTNYRYFGMAKAPCSPVESRRSRR